MTSSSSFTITLTGRKSELTSAFFPPIDLTTNDGSGSGGWEAGLLSFDSYFSVPNLIENENSNLYLRDDDDGKKVGDTRGKTVPINQLSMLFSKASPHTRFYQDKLRGNRIVMLMKGKKCFFNDRDDSVLTLLGFKKGRVLAGPLKGISEEDDHDAHDVDDTGRIFVEHVADEPVSESRIRFPKDKQMRLYKGYLYTVPTGTYEAQDLKKLLQTDLQKQFQVSLDLFVNLNTLRCGIKCSKKVDFSLDGSFGDLLGFPSNALIPPHSVYWAANMSQIFKVLHIGVAVSCCAGAYRNGEQSHVIFQFTPDVEPGFRLNVTPRNVTYHPVVTNRLDEITVRVLDQDDALVNFRNEVISIRIHFRRFMGGGGDRV